jgi:hypothetical protein
MARAPTGLTARSGAQTAIQLPITRVTAGCRAGACLVAHRYHLPHSPLELHERGMQSGFTNGTMAQRSCFAIRRIGGIHICACESPMTTIFFGLLAAPRRQSLLDVYPSRGEQLSGNALEDVHPDVASGQKRNACVP